MFVCICANVTERQIKQAARDGASSVGDLGARLGVGAGCGCCRDMAQAVLDDALDGSAAMVVTSVVRRREIARVATPSRQV
jgi:bacterioferritin-associated ferredoxin